MAFYEALRQKLLEEVQVGVTMTMVETGLFASAAKEVMCVTSSRKLYAVTELIQSVDPDAFSMTAFMWVDFGTLNVLLLK